MEGKEGRGYKAIDKGAWVDPCIPHGRVPSVGRKVGSLLDVISSGLQGCLGLGEPSQASSS